MPELPEVETIRIGLSQLIIGKKIAKVTSDWPKSFPNAEADVQEYMVNSTISHVRRRAKVLIMELDTKYSLVIHLKMTGQLVYVGGAHRFGAGHPNDSLTGRLPDKSTRVIMTFSDGSTLYFNDQRKFGWMRLVPTAEVPNIDFMKRFGPEPLDADFSANDFIARLERRQKSCIKPVLLDQTVIAGVGNIYADESLWSAKIHPETRISNIGKSRMGTLFVRLRQVLVLSIEKGGSSDRNYIDAEGRRGSYLQFAHVFRRNGQPCPRHPDTMIVKIRVAGRGTHICPKCQKVRT
jgi:formamidopyrimidine-DNA glycosylase